MPRGLSCSCKQIFCQMSIKYNHGDVEVSVETIAMFSWCSYFDMFMAVLS